MPIDISTHCVIKRDHEEDVPAFFQEWGRSVTYDESNNPLPITVAIVIEKNSGNVRECEPRRIKFVKED